MSTAPAVPAVVQRKALAVGAERWLAALPELVRALEQEWELTVGASFPDATEAFVAAATARDGTRAVLKLVVPRDGDAARHEIAVLRLAGGEGCVRLLRDDVARGALLLERLGPSLHALGRPVAERDEILCATASRLWRHAPGCDLPSGADKARFLVDFVVSRWDALGRPCSERAVAHALACARRRMAAYDPERAVLVHGDVHAWNALAAPGGFALVDPDGLLAEPEYDLGVVLREDPEEMLRGDPFERARRLAAHTGLDAVAIWEWGAIERVTTGLLCTEIGLQPVGRRMLAAADAVAGMDPTSARLR